MEVPNTEENMKKCICMTCPTYIAGDTGFFCSMDKSKNDIERKGCLCMNCALWGEYSLIGGYFCDEGKAT